MERSAEGIRKEMLSSGTKEAAGILNSSDEDSIVPARTYMAALADRQKLEKDVLRHYKVKTELTQKNDRQAAEYIRRLANGELPEIEVAVNYL